MLIHVPSIPDSDRTVVDLGIGTESSSMSGGDCSTSSSTTGGLDYGPGMRFSPHISSTYICHDASGLVGVGGCSTTQYITQVQADEAEVGKVTSEVFAAFHDVSS